MLATTMFHVSGKQQQVKYRFKDEVERLVLPVMLTMLYTFNPYDTNLLLVTFDY